MAKILGYRIRENEVFEIERQEVKINKVELHVAQRAIGPRTRGNFVAIYGIEIPQVSYVFNVDLRKFESLDAFLDTVVGKDCVIEKTQVGRNERIAYIELK